MGHTALKMIREKAPEKIGKHAALLLTVAAVAAPALIQVKSDVVANVITGMAVAGAISSINGFSQDETGALATSGFKGLLAKHVPQLGSIEAIYTEPAQMLMLAGGEYQDAPRFAEPSQNAMQMLMAG